ncbi:TPA: hypothetical protein ACHV3G_003317 [Klebsiella pneumoniae]|nr:hypothetical protein [Klebsiella pneumoniae]HDT3514822.1 hypothetical protein [Klebsiella pneumoniae subsp. pneumoniae]ELA2286466.1 hypothetical protein [Klebsiella pneumoniae]ELA2486326.1 hypothetical protein [Klebsiella pneumoniae]MCP5696043.1 hypothetical protein [Klebsiella pneumoniae]MCQ8516285.1 hypothetical protein [Klebsiella pneumoniae]
MGNLRRNAFKIVVTLDNNSATIPSECHNLKYKFSRSYFDTLEINENTITISGDRSDKPNFDEIFINNQSEIYFQIVKSYIYYCISNDSICDILEIRCYNKNNILEKKYTRSGIRNLRARHNTSSLKMINKAKAAVIFDATTDSTKYFYAMTTLVRSICSDDNNDIFEKLWKSYNSIYRSLSTKKQEWQCLEDMGRLMVTTPTQFPLAIDVVRNLTSADISDSIRWRKMLENKFITRGGQNNRESNFSAFLTKYNDFRLNELALNSINIEKNFWVDQNLKTATSTAIQNKIAANATHHAELVDVLCNNYAYFLRNKTLHGEQADHSFRFIPDNKEEKSLKFTSKILFAVVCDLINSHTL